jgi:hypothetical protein
MLRIDNGNFGVLLLCYSLDDDVATELAEHFRKSCPEGRIVAITNRPMSHPTLDVDAFVYGVEGPEVLIAAVRGETPTHF